MNFDMRDDTLIEEVILDNKKYLNKINFFFNLNPKKHQIVLFYIIHNAKYRWSHNPSKWNEIADFVSAKGDLSVSEWWLLLSSSLNGIKWALSTILSEHVCLGHVEREIFDELITTGNYHGIQLLCKKGPFKGHLQKYILLHHKDDTRLIRAIGDEEIPNQWLNRFSSLK